MPCLIALVIFSILGIFSATHRAWAKEALECVFRRVTLRPCNTGFKEKIKSRILAKLIFKSTLAARLFNRYYEALAWLFFVLMVLSTAWVVKGGYNYYLYGSCNGLNQSGFCAFDPKGENNRVTSINQICAEEENTEKKLSLDRVDLSSFPAKPADSKDTVVLIGCYECEYTRKAYPDIQKLVRDEKTNYVFAHYPAKDKNNYLSEVGYCVYRQYGERFWAFNDYLFTVDKVEINDPAYVGAILKNFNFDAAAVNACVADPLTKQTVGKQNMELIKTGLYGTPTVFINGRPLVGPKPYRVYRSMIKKFLFF